MIIKEKRRSSTDLLIASAKKSTNESFLRFMVLDKTRLVPWHEWLYNQQFQWLPSGLLPEEQWSEIAFSVAI